MAKAREKVLAVQSIPAAPAAKAVAVPVDYSAEILANMREKSEGFAGLPPAEQDAAVAAIIAVRKRTRPMTIQLQKGEGGKVALSEGKNATGQTHWIRLMHTFATGSADFASSQLDTLFNYFERANQRGCTERALNGALGFIAGMEPQNEGEAALITQMAITNEAATRCLAQLGSSDMVEHIQMFGNLSAKLLRTSTLQMETLARLRRGGEQVVKHIHIDNRGGQAVVAETVRTGGTNAFSDTQPREPGRKVAESASMLGDQPGGVVLPMSRDEGAEAVSAARGQIDRSAKG